MRRAISLAQSQHPHPNPRVGAVIVGANGSIAGTGAHVRPGLEHAEVIALHEAGPGAVGGTLYVTLEPCAHHGRTPPCADAIISAGIARVVVGVEDPDPRVAGDGLRRLREAGIDVEVGVLAGEARDMDPAYFHHRETGMPLVILKWAMTLDGAVAAADGTSQWITSNEARDDAHRLRASVDAVIVGAGTIRADDPLLDVRLPDYDGRQPIPVVVAGSGQLDAGAQLWSRSPIVVSTTECDIPAGEVLVVEGDQGRPDPVEVCRHLAERGLLHLLVEGGPTLAGSWWNAGVVKRGVVYIGAKVGGGAGLSPLAGVFESIGGARVVSPLGSRSLGPDFRIDFEV